AGLVCLGAGAGLTRSDLRNARGTAIVRRPGGVIADVRGRAPRAVPVLARYHAPLQEAAAFADGNFVTGGTEPERGNITSPLTRSLAGGGGLPALDTSRLRATWLADVAQLTGLPAFMRAAGITCSQRPGDIIAGLHPDGGEAHAVTLPAGTARGPDGGHRAPAGPPGGNHRRPACRARDRGPAPGGGAAPAAAAAAPAGGHPAGPDRPPARPPHRSPRRADQPAPGRPGKARRHRRPARQTAPA